MDAIVRNLPIIFLGAVAAVVLFIIVGVVTAQIWPWVLAAMSAGVAGTGWMVQEGLRAENDDADD